MPHLETPPESWDERAARGYELNAWSICPRKCWFLQRQIRPEHFAEETAGIYLTEEGRKIFLKAWEERLQSTFEHRTLKRHVSYRTAIRLDLYKLEKHLIGEKPYEPFKLR